MVKNKSISKRMKEGGLSILQIPLMDANPYMSMSKVVLPNSTQRSLRLEEFITFWTGLGY